MKRLIFLSFFLFLIVGVSRASIQDNAPQQLEEVVARGENLCDNLAKSNKRQDGIIDKLLGEYQPDSDFKRELKKFKKELEGNKETIKELKKLIKSLYKANNRLEAKKIIDKFFKGTETVFISQRRMISDLIDIEEILSSLKAEKEKEKLKGLPIGQKN